MAHSANCRKNVVVERLILIVKITKTRNGSQQALEKIVPHRINGSTLKSTLQVSDLHKVTSIFRPITRRTSESSKPTLGSSFAFRSRQRYDAFIDFYADQDAVIFKQLNKCAAIICFLVHSFMEEDDAAQVLIQLVAFPSSEKALPIHTTIFLGVLHIDGSQTLSDAS